MKLKKHIDKILLKVVWCGVVWFVMGYYKCNVLTQIEGSLVQLTTLEDKLLVYLFIETIQLRFISH